MLTHEETVDMKTEPRTGPAQIVIALPDSNSVCRAKGSNSPISCSKENDPKIGNESVLRTLARWRHLNELWVEAPDHIHQITLRCHHAVNVFVDHWHLI